MRFEMSDLGKYVGTAVGALTYGAVNTTAHTASAVLEVGMDTGTYLLGRTAGYLLGAPAEIAITGCGKVLKSATGNTIRSYSPAIAGVTAAVVGFGTGMAVTASQKAWTSFMDYLATKQPAVGTEGPKVELLEDDVVEGEALVPTEEKDIVVSVNEEQVII